MVQWNKTQEIDLIDLFRSFRKQKKLIALTTFICLILGLIFVFFTRPTYQTTAYLYPPSQASIEDFNVRLSEMDVLRPKQVFNLFTRNLTSEAIKRDFFNQVYLPSLPELKVKTQPKDKIYAQFLKRLTIKLADGKYLVSIKSQDAEQSSEWVKKYIELAANLTVNELVSERTKESQSIADALANEIAMAKATAKAHLLILNEAMKTAKAAGLEEPSVISRAFHMNAKSSADPSMIYLRGRKILENQVAILTAHESDDLFIRDISKLKEKYNFYKNIGSSNKSGHVFHLDSEIITPDVPLPPSKNLVILIFCLAGLMLGLGIAATRHILAAQDK